MNNITYIAIILYKSQSDDPDYTSLYEESLVRIEALNEALARDYILAFIKTRQTTFKTAVGHMITWSFLKLIDISEALESSSKRNVQELYSRHFHDIESYEKMEILAGT